MNAERKVSILFMPEGTVLAHLSRCLMVARQLDRSKFDIQFACSGPSVYLVEEAGFPLIPVTTQPREELLGRLHNGESAFTYEVLREYARAEISLFRSIRPDVVVEDFRPSLGISASVQGVPLVRITNAVWTRYYTGAMDPPDSFILTKKLGKKLCRGIAPVARPLILRHYAAPFNKVRQELWLEPQSDVRQCMSEGALTLLPDLPSFAPTKKLPANFHYVGPILWEKDFRKPHWLDDLDKNRPTVYLTLGSTGPGDKLPQLARALSEADFQVICTTGEGDIQEFPRRCFFVDYASGRQLCELADVVVCHGGNGTIYQALSVGTPVVGVPTFHDQEFNMQQVCRLGLGASLKPDEQLPLELPQTVERVLGDDSYRAKCAEFKEQLKEWNGPEEAARQITKFVSELSLASHGGQIRISGIEPVTMR